MDRTVTEDGLMPFIAVYMIICCRAGSRIITRMSGNEIGDWTYYTIFLARVASFVQHIHAMFWCDSLKDCVGHSPLKKVHRS